MSEPTFTFANNECEHCRRFVQQAIETLKVGIDIVSIGDNLGHALYAEKEEAQ